MIAFYEKHKKIIVSVLIILFLILFIMPIATTKHVSRNKEYTKKEDVALYLFEYHELPKNYITHYGMEYYRNHNKDLTNKIIGGDTHYNDGSFSKYGIQKNETLKECDIKCNGYEASGTRGTYRLVYTTNAKNIKIVYCDHYESDFQKITLFQLQIVSNVFWIIFGVYSLCLIAFAILIHKKSHPENKEKVIIVE